MKTLKERLIGGGGTLASATEETVAELEAARGKAALQQYRLLEAAAATSGQVCRTLHEWQGLRPLLESLLIKRFKAEGVLENRAQRRALDELDSVEDELGRLAAELSDVDRRLQGRHAAERVSMNARNAERQAELDRRLVAAIRASAPFSEALQNLLPEAAAIREMNDQIAHHQPGGQPNRGLVENPAQYIRTGDVAELADRAVVLHFNIIRVAPDRWR